MRVRFSSYSKKLLLRWLMLFVVIATTLLLLLPVFLAIKIAPQYHSLSPVVKNVVNEIKLIKPGLPKQLVISSININVTIDYVGLTPDGAMDIKPNHDVGWYMLGPRPGDKGNAVIAGHYGWGRSGKPAIFNDIPKLKKGDELSVIDQKGQSFTFVVREIREYNSDSDATTVFQSNDGGSHLNLITCSGVWENDKQAYSNRLVVFTDIKA